MNVLIENSVLLLDTLTRKKQVGLKQSGKRVAMDDDNDRKKMRKKGGRRRKER